MEDSPAAVAASVLRSLFTALFFYADKPVMLFAGKYRALQFIRCFIVSAFLFFLRLLRNYSIQSYKFSPNPSKGEKLCSVVDRGGGDLGISRALSQVLSIVAEIPVSSRKYEIVRTLAEKLIDENLQAGSEALMEVNSRVLTAAFHRNLNLLGSAAADHGGGVIGGGGDGIIIIGQREYYRWICSVFRAAKFYGEMLLRRRSWREEMSRSEVSAEKLAAELLWLAQKMADCGCEVEAVRQWAEAQSLARLSLSAEPRLQGSLVKVSAFLLEQARKLWKEADEESTKHELTQINVNILVSWLPLLCRASNGTDTPVLSISRRAEIERTLVQIISTFNEEEQERVLSLWLHHFTYCPTSDWPNLQDSYSRWCSASRKSLLFLK